MFCGVARPVAMPSGYAVLTASARIRMGGGGPIPTYRILTEGSDNLAAENGDTLRTE